MSEFLPPGPESLIDSIRAKENEFEEPRRERFLAKTLFYETHLDEILSAEDANGITVDLLELEYLDDKRGKNMGERFDLALSDKYLGKIHIVDLGTATNPTEHHVDALKHEYLDLLDWMPKHGIEAEDIPRHAAPRKLEGRPSVASDDHFVLHRSRLLIDSSLIHVRTGAKVDFRIAKRMTFAMHNAALHSLMARGSEGESATLQDIDIEHLEFLLDNKLPSIIPIRTSYYLATRFA